MDKLGFVKTVEAILAAVIAMSIYTFVQSQSVNQIQSPSRGPAIEINDFINSIMNTELRTIIKDYDYLKLDSLFNKLFFESVYYYFEPVYFEKINVKSETKKQYPNISFIYHFPKGIDKNSIRIINNGYELGTKALFNWYYVPVKFNESISDSYAEINFTIQDLSISNKSLMFFVRNKESILSLKQWSIGPNNINVSVIAYVPEINSLEECYVYFAKNTTFVNFTYPSLSKTVNVSSTFYNRQEARTAEVIFTPDNISDSGNNYFIKYSLFSNEQNNYANITLVNNTGVTVLIENNKLKTGSTPYTTSIKGKDSVKKIIPIKEGFVELRIYGGFS